MLTVRGMNTRTPHKQHTRTKKQHKTGFFVETKNKKEVFDPWLAELDELEKEKSGGKATTAGGGMCGEPLCWCAQCVDINGGWQVVQVQEATLVTKPLVVVVVAAISHPLLLCFLLQVTVAITIMTAFLY